MSKNVKTPASQCKAKGGPTTCPYHSKAIIREMDSEIDNLSESISLMQSEKTKSSGLEAARLQNRIIKAEAELKQRKYELNTFTEASERNIKSLSYYNKIQDGVRKALSEGTHDTDNHPTSITVNGHHATVIRESALPSSTVKALKNAGFQVPRMMELGNDDESALAFQSAIANTRKNNKYAAAVYVYNKDEYKNMRMFLSEDGLHGYALKKQVDDNGKTEYDIVSVFSIKKKQELSNIIYDKYNKNNKIAKYDNKPSGQSIITNAVANGGTILDCYDTVLPALYASVGFKQYNYYDWDDKYKPDDWDYTAFDKYNHGRPGVVYMRFDPVSCWKAPELHNTPSYDSIMSKHHDKNNNKNATKKNTIVSDTVNNEFNNSNIAYGMHA